MPSTVHKVLIHGAWIIAEASLPIDLLSEEAQEVQNKTWRQNRLSHSRKCGRKETNQDVMHLMFASSDPYINIFREEPKANVNPYDKDVLALLEVSDTPDDDLDD